MKMKPDFGAPKNEIEKASHDWLVEHLGQEGEWVMQSLAALIDSLRGPAATAGTRDELAAEFAKRFPAVLAQYSQFKIVDWFLARAAAATPARDVTEAMALAGARSIGNTIHTDNHGVRARECWRAMWDARDGIVEPIPQGALVSRPHGGSQHD